jgi:hypothetical protein
MRADSDQMRTDPDSDTDPTPDPAQDPGIFIIDLQDDN